jgi:hypothetical protein
VTAFLHAGAGLFLVFVVPGVLLLTAVRTRLTYVEWIALVPACSLAVISVLAELLRVTGLPFGPVAFFVVLGLLGVVNCLVVLRARGRNVAGVAEPTRALAGTRNRDVPRNAVSIGLLVIAIVVTSATLLSGMKGHATTPPAHDGAAHGFIAARISHTESVRSEDVLVSDGSGQHEAYGYYPLALHESLAIAHRVTGADIGYLLDATSVFFGALVFPLGLYALTRFLVPDIPLAAGFAAVLGALFVLFPYEPVTWSGIPLLAGMALVPITVVLLVRTATSHWSRRAALLSGLVVVAGFTLHNSQLPLVLAAVAALLIAAAIRAHSTRLLIDAVTRLVWIGVVAVVLLVPTITQVATGGSERASSTLPVADRVHDVGNYLGRLVTLEANGSIRQGWLAILAILGIAFLLRRHERVEWIVLAVAVGALATAAATSQGTVANALTFPWYQQSQRLAYYLAFFAPVFGGIALGLVVAAIARHVPWGSWTTVAVTAVILCVAVPVTAAHAVDSSHDIVKASYRRSSPVQSDSVAAFEFMRDHSDDRDSVLNDVNVDGSLWMYTRAGVRPVFGLEPLKPDRSWKDRIHLVSHIGDLGRDPKVDRLIRRLHVRFVYFGEDTFHDMSHIMNLATLRSTPGLREVFHEGGAHVFRVVDST